MTRAELFLFLGNCLSIDYVPDNAAKARKIIASGSVSYEQLAALASSHFVTPALYSTFTNSNITDSVPAGFVDYLREIHELNRVRNSRIVSQVKEISTLLKASAIHPIFLKGAASLFDNLYSDTGDRIMADIDFLVNSNEFDACIEIMISAGYAPLDNMVKMAKHDKHYPRLFKKGEVAGVEVHRTPAGEKYTPWFNYDIISAEAGASRNDKEIIVPSDNHKAVLNFIHSQLSHKGHLYGFVSLRDAFDLMLIQRRIDRPLTDIPQPYKRKASAYFSLAAGLTGTTAIKTDIRHVRHSVFTIQHKMNISSSALRRLNYTIARLILYFLAIGSALVSGDSRRRLWKKLRTASWYIKHFRTWKKIAGIR